MAKRLMTIILILLFVLSGCTPSVNKTFVNTLNENVRQPIGPLQTANKEMTLSVFLGETWSEALRKSLTIKPTVSFDGVTYSLISYELESEYSTGELNISGPSIKIPKGYSIQFYIIAPNDKWNFNIGNDSYEVKSLSFKNPNKIVWDYEVFDEFGAQVDYSDIYDDTGKLIDHSKQKSVPVNHGDGAKIFNGHYYNVWHIEGKSVTWEYANELAKNDGGYLLQIGTTVDKDGYNIEAQFVYSNFCSPGEYYIMGSQSKFYGDSNQISWYIPMANTEYLESWIVEYDY